MRIKVLLSIALVVGFNALPVSAEKICLKTTAKIKANGKVKVKQLTEEVASTATCPDKFIEVVDTEKTGPVVGFAKVTGTGGSPAIRSFGGREVTAASLVRNATGSYVVTFEGGVDSRFTYDGLPVFCTVDAGGFCSAFISNDVTSTSTEIEIGILTTDTTGAAANKDFSVAMMLGVEQ